MGFAIVWLVNAVISLMIWFIIAQAILSWLVAFDVINYRNRFVYSVGSFLDQITRPLLEPFRRIIPNLGGIDMPFAIVRRHLTARQAIPAAADAIVTDCARALTAPS